MRNSLSAARDFMILSGSGSFSYEFPVVHGVV